MLPRGVPRSARSRLIGSPVSQVVWCSDAEGVNSQDYGGFGVVAARRPLEELLLSVQQSSAETETDAAR